MLENYRRKGLPFVTLALLLAISHAAIAAGPTHVTEPGSGQKLATTLKIENKNFLLVGTGLLRKKDSSPVYAMGLYVDDLAKPSFIGVYDRAGRRHAGLFFESRAQNFYIWGHFTKLAVLRYLRPTTRDELQQSFREGLADVLGAQAPADVKKDALSFISLFDADVKEGQEVYILNDDVGHLDVYIDGKRHEGPQNAKLSRHVWDIWLGFHPVARDMRNGLLDRLELLAK